MRKADSMKIWGRAFYTKSPSNARTWSWKRLEAKEKRETQLG
jgi:hypothetical protein